MSIFVRSYKRRDIFLTSLQAGDSESAAARNAGSKLKDFKKWKEEDLNFKRDWDDAIEEGTDYLEDIATDRAMRKSDPLMIMMLKARRPDKYDRGSKLELSGSVNVEGSKAKLLNRLQRLRDQGKEAEEIEEVQAQIEETKAQKLLPAPASVGAAKAERRSAGAKRRRPIGGGQEQQA